MYNLTMEETSRRKRGREREWRGDGGTCTVQQKKEEEEVT